MRKALWGAAIAALILVLYAAAGYWLAPRLLAEALRDRAAAAGVTLGIGATSTDPFALELQLAGVTLDDGEGRRLASAEGIALDLAWASLWRDAWIVQRATIRDPFVEVVIGDAGAAGWPAAGAGREAAAAPSLFVRAISVEGGTLHVLDRARAAPVELTLQEVQLELQNLATAGGEAQYSAAARIAGGGTFASQGTVSLAPRAAHGELALEEVPLAIAWQLAAPALEPAQGSLSARTRYAYEDGRLVLHDAVAQAESVIYRGLELAHAEVGASELVVPPEQAIAIRASARTAGGASVSARGRIRPRPFGAQLELEASAVPLRLAQRLLPESVAIRIASGAVSGKGALEAGKQGVAYRGSAEVRALELQAADSGAPVLGWKLARTRDVTLRTPARMLELGEVLVQAPHARLVIEAGGKVDLAQLFGGAGGDGEPPLQASLQRLRLEDGRLHFADRSLETPFEATIRELSGTVTGFSTRAGDPALVALAGRVGQYGSAKIRGTIDLDDPKSLANVTAQFRNVDLAQLTPYVAKFAGYRVRSGRLAADLRYRVKDGRLSGENELVLRSLELGERVERAGAKDLPLELAVALLADAEGRITLDIPVGGNLNDPQFDFGGLVARALGNAIGKIASAPFRALAGLFDGDTAEELAEVRFAAGSAQLTPPQEENLAKVAQALAARPRLQVAVRAAYDPQADAAALRRDQARRAIARAAGYEWAGPLDFSDPKTLHAAENLYLDRVGNRLELQALRKQEERYGGALVEALAAAVPAHADAARALGAERAEAVRAALLEHGLPPIRVSLGEPVAGETGEEGVPTRFVLEPAQRRAAEEYGVADAQRALEAAGFDPGPVDGLLGPRTEAALRRFQAARRLEPTGELDAPTLAALGAQGENASAGGTR